MNSKRGPYQKQPPVISKAFDPAKPLSQAAFSSLLGLNKSSAHRGVENKIIFAESDSTIIPAKNSVYIIKHLLSKKSLLHADPVRRERNFQILHALNSNTKLPAIPEPFAVEKMKVSDEDNFYYYDIGTFPDDESEFMPLLQYGIFPGGESEILVYPNSETVTAVTLKNKLVEIHVDSYRVTEPLFMCLK